MRTSLAASPSRSGTPHKYWTRNNTNPTSPPTLEPLKPGFRNTPPAPYTRKNNLLTFNRGHTLEDSDSEDDEYPPKSPLQSALQILRNISMWIGLTFLTTNVWVLAQFKRLWVWKDPFLDTDYNRDEPEDPYRFETSTPYARYEREPSPVPVDKNQEVGWCGFGAALAFLASLILLLSVIVVPSPISVSSVGSGNEAHLFSFLETHREVEARVSSLEKNQLAIIKSLEKEKERAISELVAIAKLSKQNSEQIKSQSVEHHSHLTELRSAIEDSSGRYNAMVAEIASLKLSLNALSKLQDGMTSDLTSSEEEVKVSLGEIKQLVGQLRTEVIANQSGASKETEKIQGLISYLTSKYEELAAKQAVFAEQPSPLIEEADSEEAGSGESLQGSAVDIEKLREELKSEIQNLLKNDKVDVVYRPKLEDLTSKLDDLAEKLTTTDAKLSDISGSIPKVPSDLQSQLETLSSELRTLHSTSLTPDSLSSLENRITEIRAALAGHVAHSDKEILDIHEILSRLKESERFGNVKLQTVESKLAVVNALQSRLDKMETAGKDQVDKKGLQKEIAGVLGELKSLDAKYGVKIAEVYSTIDGLKSTGDKRAAENVASLREQAEQLNEIEAAMKEEVAKLQEKFISLEISNDKKIRNVVLEVLASVTENKQGTRFFGDWLKALFISSEQFNEREIRNETIVLPSQEELVQIVITELNTKHAIDLKPGSGITSSDIRIIIREALQTFDEDKTGRADFALETLGGSVLSVGCTETYYEGAPFASFMSVPLFQIPNAPSVALQPDITPGKCWAFKGTKGYMMIRLARAVVIDSFSMEHLPRKLSLNNDISSAPNKFSVRGISHAEDTNSHLFGEYAYSDTSTALQAFNVQKASKVAYEIVELDIESNHGNPDYTCLYRIRIHGSVPNLL